jgi:hypothetical protein
MGRATERQGTIMKGTEDNGGEGILRVGFAELDETLKPVGWDKFFTTFGERNAAFLQLDKPADKHVGRFFKFVRREG